MCEHIDSAVRFLDICSRYYDKVFFVAGNHEYYLSKLIKYNGDEQYNGSSYSKIIRIIELTRGNDKIEFLDRTNINSGITEYKGFTIAGDTLWYLPKNFRDWLFYYFISNDSRMIKSDKSSTERIKRLNLYSTCWYECLPENVDLMISHIPPTSNPESDAKKIYGCYNNVLEEFKAKFWIYGHDHIESDFEKDGTRFVSNPWGYHSKDFKVKTLTLKK